MSGTDVLLVPVSFGFGPAALAAAVAHQLHAQRPDLRLTGVGDGPALDFLRRCGYFDGALAEAPQGGLPSSVAGSDPPIAVLFADFDRFHAARRLGLRTVVVDPLYWMWDQDPVEPSHADRYLALAFPGLQEHVACRDGAESVHIIPQIVDTDQPAPAAVRTGTMLNLGGAFAPMGHNHRYLRALIESVAAAMECHDLLVTCSSAAAERIGRCGASVTITELSFAEMIAALTQRVRLLTLPGQSIMWEALQTSIPTVVLPGANYSHHRQVEAYRAYFTGVEFITWDDFAGYATLPAGMPEETGVRRAVELGERWAGDRAARARLTERLAAILATADPPPPALRGSHPWSSFDGAAHVAREIVALVEVG